MARESDGSSSCQPPPTDLHERLTRRAAREGTSLGELVRRACQLEYGGASDQERQRALEELLALALPVAEPDPMKRESVPAPEEIMGQENRPRRRPSR